MSSHRLPPVLSDSETATRIREAILTGDPVDLRTDNEKADPGDASEWETQRPLSARMLADVLRRNDWPRRPQRLWLGGARITGCSIWMGSSSAIRS